MQLLNSKRINIKRRNFLAVIIAATATALLLPLRAVAAMWNKAAFDAEKLADAQNNSGNIGEIPSSNIVIIAPDRAENGAIVQVEIATSIPNVEAIAIFVEKNPTPLIANIMLGDGAQAKLVTRIKMAETSDIKAISHSASTARPMPSCAAPTAAARASSRSPPPSSSSRGASADRATELATSPAA